MKLTFLTLLLFILSTPLHGNKIGAVLQEASLKIIAQQYETGEWNLPASLGPHYVSQYYLLSRWLDRTPGTFDAPLFIQLLSTEQRPDGSWDAVRDGNRSEGDLNATIFNYWALKALGISPQSETLRNARNFILKKGGTGAAAAFTKVFLALFRQASWESIPAIPVSAALGNGWVDLQSFAQWIEPNVVPIAYFRARRLSKELGNSFSLSELGAAKLPPDLLPLPSHTTRAFGRKLLAAQKPHGSWGGYTLSTLLSVVVLQDIGELLGNSFIPVGSAIEKGISYVDFLYFQPGVGSYRGAVDDGRFWDTALILNGLLDSGYQGPSLERAAKVLARSQTASGGFPFGLDFDTWPDTDDTGLIVTALSQFPEYASTSHRGVQWLTSMQNDDGGWGAFAKNCTGNFFLNLFAKGFGDSAELFDSSSADVTGHILEAFGAMRFTVRNSGTVRRAVHYLRATQERDGTWQGRWGVNYLYGTSAATVGLLKVGISPSDPMIARALNWFGKKQNPDGGFGESTRSYIDPKWKGRGDSTPTQTAWALLALVEGGRIAAPNTRKAIDLLITTFEQKGAWKDISAVGTGHRKLIYMDYPSYPIAWPMMALGQAKRALEP